MPEEGKQLVACIPRLRRYARALVSDHALADDLVQDTLERAWNKLALWRSGSDMRAWLFGIMHNLHVNQIRRPALATVALEGDAFDLPVRASQGDQLEVRDLHSALQLLPGDQRAVLLLVALEQMSYEEVASTLDIPLGTVMSRLARGREKLRAQMEGAAAVPASVVPLKVVK
ncbi:RNA polymerase sigma factor [Undibacterium sp.]|uniref:RNA polymerase sigma factor n=1 Tax=Undibacterium sp. TaxID=1914977 RepID=UPI002C1C9C27|nr:RNA polymerase sigma factor [Undibacterium sp.]HTD03801.1 RNA polymerase sigma factor [Undibacterium sp.]